MAQASKIEWTDATWNPVRGCSRISIGCGGPNHEGGCYAEKIAARFSDPGQAYHGLARRTRDGGRWTGKMELVEHMLHVPQKWKQPRRIFVNSMSDLFHENLPFKQAARVIAATQEAPQHIYQILTKRADRMYQFVEWWCMRHAESKLPSNLWFGVSVEDQEAANERIPHLLRVPAAVLFLSCEPLLGPVNFSVVPGFNRIGLDLSNWWVIAGGESGPTARPMHPDWVRSARDQCQAAGVPFFFKQWGEWAPAPEIIDAKGASVHQFADGAWSQRIGKKNAGRLLDGRTWDEFPQVTP